MGAPTTLRAHPQDARTPLSEAELTEVVRRLEDAADPHPAHTRAWAVVAIQQLRRPEMIPNRPGGV